MTGSIIPLPVMLEQEDQKVYDKLEPPSSIVCRYGYMKQIAELPYNGDAKPGCGSKLVIRSHRGIELAEMLTTTCPNSGCASAVSRQQMLGYIDNSGGKDYPFSRDGKVLRVATTEDINDQSKLDNTKPKMIRFTKELLGELDLPMRLVDIELLLGGERIIFHYTSEQWVDFRDLVRRLAQEYQTRIEMHQVNARDEARIVADYEKCGQYCCCKQFLKVLKPVSMKSAKVQKATLDPAKISGRCGRLMCCLRYEDQTYSELKKLLPYKQSFVKTEDGNGVVIDGQILTQLVLVRLDATGQMQAYAVEKIEVLARDVRQAEKQGLRPPPQEVRPPRSRSSARPAPRRDAKPDPKREQPKPPVQAQTQTPRTDSPPEGDGSPKRRKRRRRRGGRGRNRGGGNSGNNSGGNSGGGAGDNSGGGAS